jgi:hypothetical protein
MEDYLGESVINLSDLELTPDQVSVLSKGLTFCPTPWEPDMSDIIQNLENFFRRMRLKSHFLVDDPESDLDFDLGSQTTLDQTQTGNKKEPSEHQGDVRNKRNHKPVAHHFNSPNHSIKSMQCTILETITQDPELPTSTIHRRSREVFWINRLRTLDPLGLNAFG